MRSTYDHVATTLNRFAALATTDAEEPTANKVAASLTARSIFKDNGSVFTGHDVRQWRSVNRDLTEAQREALLQAHAALAGDS
tara:strand:- start:2365 stop:2613 length:249 start_codon:yes stop_codon:yes gene_type:complete